VQTDKQAMVNKPIFLNISVLFISLAILSIFTLMFTGGNYISIAVVAILLASLVIAFFAIIIAFIRKEVGKKKYYFVTGIIISSILITFTYQALK
jgi:succinate-acetate transporter protein